MKVKYALLSGTLLFAIAAAAQHDTTKKFHIDQQKGHDDSVDIVAVSPPPPPQQKIYTYVEQMPDAGYDMGKYLSENLHYPDTARKYRIHGSVILSFVVNEDGSLSEIKAIRGIGGGCDEEAVKVVSNMPRWKRPGKQNGKAVKVRYTLPVIFKLED